MIFHPVIATGKSDIRKKSLIQAEVFKKIPKPAKYQTDTETLIKSSVLPDILPKIYKTGVVLYCLCRKHSNSVL